ncbi:hypothetical protein [Limibacillus sp. MBR-115]|jgi:hypothetical protein|uniref:hypothetical protein n=1 Tax=Limibacillus sp. MBR-115 TaxID=3156465 RepID=UPI00339751A2
MRFGFFLTVALVVSLGVGLAAVDRAQAQLATDLVCNGCVDSTDVQDGSLGPQDLIPGSINTTTIANTSITGNKISGGAVTGAKIANGTISPLKLIPGSINTSTLATNSITSNKINNGAVLLEDLNAEVVGKLEPVNVVVVGADGTATENCTALRNAIAGISDASVSNGYLVRVGPGDFDCGGNEVVMKPFVDVEGSGQNVTLIRGVNTLDAAAIVFLADNSELRHATVQNNGGSSFPHAIRKSTGIGRVSDLQLIGFAAELISCLGGGRVIVRDSHLITPGNATAYCASAVTIIGGEVDVTGTFEGFNSSGSLCTATVDEAGALLSNSCGPLL